MLARFGWAGRKFFLQMSDSGQIALMRFPHCIEWLHEQKQFSFISIIMHRRNEKTKTKQSPGRISTHRREYAGRQIEFNKKEHDHSNSYELRETAKMLSTYRNANFIFSDVFIFLSCRTVCFDFCCCCSEPAFPFSFSFAFGVLFFCWMLFDVLVLVSICFGVWRMFADTNCNHWIFKMILSERWDHTGQEIEPSPSRLRAPRTTLKTRLYVACR